MSPMIGITISKQPTVFGLLGSVSVTASVYHANSRKIFDGRKIAESMAMLPVGFGLGLVGTVAFCSSRRGTTIATC